MSKTVDELVADFAAHLTARAGDVRALAGLGNSFEGWLKGEMCLMGARAKTPVGAEYAARLVSDGATKGLHQEQKHIDVWMTVDAHGPKHHYIELKVAFGRVNRLKQLASWIADADALSRLDANYEQAAGAASVLIGVGLSDEHVEKALLAADGKRPVPSPTIIVDDIRLWALTYAF